MINILRKMAVFGRLFENELILHKEVINGEEKVFITIGKWVFQKHDFMACLVLSQTQHKIKWSKYPQYIKVLNKFQKQINDVWQEIGLELEDEEYDKFFKRVVALIKSIKLDQDIHEYTNGNRSKTIVHMIERLEELPIESNPIPV